MTHDHERDDGQAPAAPAPMSSPETVARRYQSASEEPPPAGHPGTGYQTDSREPARQEEASQSGSPGYQSESSERASSEKVSGSPSTADDEVEEEYMDPHKAYALAVSKERDRKEREKRRREPGTWLPDGDDLDREREGPEDRETRFSRDSWGGRGNPQVSVRLRPTDFARLRRAAELYGVRPTTLARMMVIRGVGAIIEAELRREGEFFR